MVSEKTLTAMIVPFYLGAQTDLAGRTIQQIWTWNFEELECIHDYIQWLFPISEKSHFNASAPLVNEQVIETFRKNPLLQQNLSHSFSIMLNFYGLKTDIDKQGKVTVERSTGYPVRKQEWVQMLDHNYLRITRILKCLMTFDLKEEAQAFYDCLNHIYQEDKDLIGRETFQYWTDSVFS